MSGFVYVKEQNIDHFVTEVTEMKKFKMQW